ncbi:myotonin-protein kinase isoform X24 [Macaca fascicularis]|uniref:myotonin-protein kinase isoform X24 n=1 Tax=Macaca fascicularis TaxID=9541 RepID=UPI003D15A61B
MERCGHWWLWAPQTTCPPRSCRLWAVGLGQAATGQSVTGGRWVCSPMKCSTGRRPSTRIPRRRPTARSSTTRSTSLCRWQMKGSLRRLKTSSSVCCVPRRHGWAGVEQVTSGHIPSSLASTGMVSETACPPLHRISKVPPTHATSTWWRTGSLPWRRCRTFGKVRHWGSTCLLWATPTPAWPSGGLGSSCPLPVGQELWFSTRESAFRLPAHPLSSGTVRSRAPHPWNWRPSSCLSHTCKCLAWSPQCPQGMKHQLREAEARNRDLEAHVRQLQERMELLQAEGATAVTGVPSPRATDPPSHLDGPPAVALGQCPLVGPGPMHRRHLLLPARVPRPGLSEALSLLLFAVALSRAAALGCAGLVVHAGQLTAVWRRPGAARAP